jgi:hypothetical protein
MKSALPFVSLVLVGLLGSLHSPPSDSHSSITSEQEVRAQDRLTIVAGMIEALHPDTHTITVKTDQGRIVLLRLNSLRAFSRLAIGTRVRVEIDWNDDDWATRAFPQDTHSRI